jgi:hypothetical protein
MALHQEMVSGDDDPFDQLNPYWRIIVYEYALRREAGLEAKEALRWACRRVLPPPEGLHPVVAMIAGYPVEGELWERQASSLLRTLIVAGDKSWHHLREKDGWRPGTVGMGW